MSESSTEIVHVRCVLRGDVARMYRELESRGLVKSVREAVTQGISAFYEKVMERDLLEARAKTSNQLAERL
ncbi:MAG TPA: hypothetical protein VMW03_08020 [Candidatus Krumholzibacteriaceae bacterium]|nr:hypothetical protein [Candidatus Krumholzibacteriaceae bacterium]